MHFLLVVLHMSPIPATYPPSYLQRREDSSGTPKNYTGETLAYSFARREEGFFATLRMTKALSCGRKKYDSRP
jgi:hypothetical protein